MAKIKRNGDVLAYRNPEQKEMAEGIYQGYLKHHGITSDKPEAQSHLIEISHTDRQPFISTLSASTGFGKTLVGIEPHRWLSQALDENSEDYWMADDLEESEFAAWEKAGKNKKIPSAHNGIFAKLSMYDSDSGKMPIPVTEGAVAVHVRTRSQTQAFLREAETCGFKAIALPSKASVCRGGCMEPAETSGEFDIREGTDYLSMREAENLLENTSNPLDGGEIKYLDAEVDTTYGVNRYLPRLHSMATDSCGSCPLSILNYQRSKKSFEEGRTLRGEALEAFVIQRAMEVPELENYVNEASQVQLDTKDLEESTSELWKRYPNICPYPAIRNGLREFNFIILTYPYLFNPSVASAIHPYIEHVKHVIVDEAHNIESLYQQLSTQVFPGEDYFESVNDPLREFDMLSDTSVKELQANRKKLFTEESPYESELSSRMAEKISEDASEETRELVRKQVINEMANDGIIDEADLIGTFENANDIVHYFTAWLSFTASRYVEYYEWLYDSVGGNENKIQSGFAVDSDPILEVLFGKVTDTMAPLKFADAYNNTTNLPPYTIYHGTVCEDAQPYRTMMNSPNNFFLYFDRLEKLLDSSILEAGIKSKVTEVRTICKVTLRTIRILHAKMLNYMRIVQVLALNHPEKVLNWKLEHRIDGAVFERLMLQYNPYFSTSSDRTMAKNYFMNGLTDWDTLKGEIKKALSQHDLKSVDDLEAFAEDPDCDESVAQLIRFQNKLEMLFGSNRRPSERDEQEICELLELPNVPTYQYNAEWPFSTWRIYYRYFDDHFQIAPLTLGKHLAGQFEVFDSVNMLSGTFPSLRFMQAFWGLSPAEFNAKSKVGKMTLKAVRGVSSKFQDRNPQTYAKYNKIISDAYYNHSKKNVLVAFTSGAMMKDFIQHCTLPKSRMWPHPTDLIGPNAEPLQLNDMIEELNSVGKSGERKVFFVVMNSRFTEGVEYVDAEGHSLLDSVVICGIPYPPPDVHLEDRKEYAQRMFNMDKWGGFSLVNFQMAYQAVRQTMGRAVRSNNDHATIVLADDRFTQQQWTEVMPLDESIDVSHIPELKINLTTGEPTDESWMDDDIPF